MPVTLARRIRSDARAARIGGALLAIEAGVVASYLAFADVTVSDPVTVLFPLVWINVGLWAIWRVDPPAADRRRRLSVGLLAATYFVLLSFVGGVVVLTAFSPAPPPSSGLRIVYATFPPGIAPAALYAGSAVSLTLFPYQLVGYFALAYLVYATALEAAGTALSGLLGVFSCLSCAWPVVGTVAAGLFGSGSAVYAVASSQSYALSTLVFVSAVLLLLWRPNV